MAETGFRTAVVVAIIGLIGTIGAAVIANWDKFSEVKMGTHKVADVGNPVSAAHEEVLTPKVLGSATQEVPKEADTFRITSISPPLSTALTGDTGDVTISVHYEFYSADSATLTVWSARYKPGPEACAGSGLTGGALGSSRVFISRGSGDRTMTVRNLSSGLASTGYLGLNASVSVGVPGTLSYRELADVPPFHEYCYRVAGNE